MVGVTDRAKEALLQRRRLADIRSPEIGLRLACVAPGEVVLVPDRVKAGDQIVKHEDSTVLLVDAELSEGLLAGRTVDCGDTGGGGSTLVVRATMTVVPDSVAGNRRPRQARKRPGRPWPPSGAGPTPPTTAA